MKPTREVVEAAETAYEDFMDYLNFDKKLPLSGGLDDQYWDWVYGIESVQSAYTMAQKQCQLEYEEMQDRINKAKTNRGK